MELNETLGLINDRVRALRRYHLEPVETSVKLNQNENPFDWPPEIKHEICARLEARPWNRYPDFIPETLLTALGRYLNVPAENICVGNGSNEMLLVLLLALMRPDAPVITCQPTFTVYRLLINGLGGFELPVSLTSALAFDEPALMAALASHPQALLLLCSPNNPTGSALDETAVRRLLAAHRGFCILDQAYVEFGGFNAVELIKEYPNLIVTRTFSKAFAAAGLRIGYMIGNPAVMQTIGTIKLPYNINFMSDLVARTLLDKTDIIKRRVALIIAQREALLAELARLPLDAVYPSAANFICVRTAKKDALFDFLKQKSILVRDVSAYPQLFGCLRISVGAPAENRLLVNAVAEFFGPGN
ncbi:MAG: histidinol-phosphate transaminase [Chitinivibrionales bacterium]|nr:histidinol-phosphate transaminase [Chitinivibrionales bacterium]